MQQLTPHGQNLINDIANRYGLSNQSATNMLISVNNGGGSMAQFSIPELGSGQWMNGGMTMVGDLFDYNLKNTVNNLCGELSSILQHHQVFQPLPKGAGGGSGNNWWPGDLGSPSSSGSQNNIRYAFFPQSRRLAVQRDGSVSLFDTLDHNISGVSQQQGGDSSLTFSSQYGTVSSLSLPLISGPGFAPAVSDNFAAPQAVAPVEAAPQEVVANQSQQPQQGDVITLLEKLGQLRDAGILSPQEFDAKKSELLTRI